MSSKSPESFEIAGLITKRNDSNHEKTRNSSKQLKRKAAQHIGTLAETSDSPLVDEDQLQSNEGSSDTEFTPDSDKVSCTCKKSTKGTFMVRCHICKGLFHGSCIGIDSFYYEAMTQAGDVWLCPICASLDTGKDIDSFLRPTAQEHSKEDTPDMDIHLSTDDTLKESLEILESSSELSTQKVEVHEPDKDPLLCDSYNEEYVLCRLSAALPVEMSNCGDYHLLSNPNYIPKLNEVISLINKAKNGHITLCTSPPAKEDVKGGYIYVFKSENDLLENTTNEGEWSIGDGFLFSSIVMKKFPITNSDISIIERLESNSNSDFKRRAVWLSSDPSTIVVAYIGSKSSTNASVNRGNNDDVKLVILEDQKLSLNNRSSIKSVPISYKVSRAILSLPPGISVVPESSSPSLKQSNPPPKKANIEVVDLSSDDEDTTKSGQNTPNSSSKKRKKRLQYTPKRLVMPNLPPKQSEYLKYRRKLSMDVSGEKTPHPPNEENNSCSLKISNVQTLTE
eukprot:TRINITY_DN4045_c0_g1_i1.p1 TRINITY_DN4045_c0_g1~~TRINITY_DN4045_c0_g1_i1.p1  ORF type:complete len:508 (+),score=110.02 TRINITY_DN4045_c0_g1_i1:84-1607(+)